MMHKTVAGAGLLVLLHLALAPKYSGESPCPERPCAGRGQTCQDRETDDTRRTSLEDAQIEQRLIEQGSRLIHDGQTVDTRVLINQLQREFCRLDLPGGESVSRDPVQIYRRAKEAVVVVAGFYKCRNCSRWHTTTASGFAIDSRGAIATNHHVVNDANLTTLVVMTSDQRVFPVQEVLAADPVRDVAILKIPAEDLTPLPIADDLVAAPVGADVCVVSHPDGNFYTYTSGIVSRRMRIRSAGQVVDAVSITADYARGSSGAPVLNQFGQVVAIVMSTESVYYSENSRYQRDLQMVFKTCIPSTSLAALVRAAQSKVVAVAPLSSG
jgi:S1-C subfamily serine protease